MTCNASLLALLLALVLADDEMNGTLYEPDSLDLNFTLLDTINNSWSGLQPLASRPPLSTHPPLPQMVALIGEIATKATETAATTVKPAIFAFLPPARVPVVPHYHQGSRRGPYFEDGDDAVNLTARVGSTVRLDCRIGMLQDKTVSWLHRKPDSIHLLTVGRQAYSSDQRITLSFRYPNNWRLEILYVTRRDGGVFECQVATHPPRVRTVFLVVTAPEVVIMDEKSHETSERYYKAGSAVELTCLARHIEPPTDSVEWRFGPTTLMHGISFNKSLGDHTVVATLTIPQGQKSHSGNYTCAVGNLASAVIAVHILNGELPAAVHHGNSACLARIICTHWLVFFIVVATFAIR